MPSDGAFHHQRARFPAQALAEIGMMRAVKNIVDGGASFRTDFQKMLVYGVYLFVAIAALGDAALIGDDDQFESSHFPCPQGIENRGKNVEFFKTRGIVTGVVIDHAISV